MKIIQFYPIDISYKIIDDKAQIHIFGKTKENQRICIIDQTFEPYFLIELKDKDKLSDAKTDFLNLEINDVKITKTELVEKKILGKSQTVLKLFTQLPSQIPIAANFFSNLESVRSVYEFDIKFALRYLIDKQITPMVLTEAKGKFVKDKFIAESIKQNSDYSLTDLKVLGFDIETYNPLGQIYLPEKNPIIMLSVYGKDFRKVITWKKFDDKSDYIDFVNDEKGLLEKFKEIINSYQPDIIVGYHSDGFDFPYIEKRAEKLGIKLDMGLDQSLLKIKDNEARIIGLPHIDIYKFILKVMSRALKLNFYTLDNVAEKLLGERKLEIEITKLASAWDDNIGLDQFCKYNLRDAELAHNLFINVFPNMLELIKIVGLPIYTLSRATHSQFVESYILKNTLKYNEIILNRPTYHEREKRYSIKYQGAFVYQPTAGLYENLVVVDFKSFYPSVIVSYNICPSSLNCNCCLDTKNKIEIENETMRFCEKKKGFLSSVLEYLITTRADVKKQLKKDKKNILLNARSQALKDLSNAFYGYLGFSSARWYNFDCAQAITALARKYIKDTILKAENEGFKVVYGDTDSVFLALNKKEIKDVEKFVKNINKDLPGIMELELEEFYTKGIFVSTKSTAKGAKKRYALIDKEGELKIRGFESVRRNIAPITKEVQETILSIILNEKTFKQILGNKNRAFHESEKAVIYLKEIINKLKTNKIPIEQLIISTLLQKPINEYSSSLPHVAIARDLQSKGYEIHPGAMIKYVVIKGKGRINQRVKLPEEVKQEDYDSDYYINNQILPAVDKIFEALGYSLEELLIGKDQSSLQSFIK